MGTGHGAEELGLCCLDLAVAILYDKDVSSRSPTSMRARPTPEGPHHRIMTRVRPYFQKSKVRFSVKVFCYVQACYFSDRTNFTNEISFGNPEHRAVDRSIKHPSIASMASKIRASYRHKSAVPKISLGPLVLQYTPYENSCRYPG